jgi:alpha-1,6-mannosyltransferase
MKVCDVTQFYSPYGGGVKRYLSEKRRYVRECTDDEHVLIIPGARNEHIQEGRLHTYTIESPPVSYTSRYRALINQQAVRQLLREIGPDVIESGDPYQVAWTALGEAHASGTPIVGFYHSHFPEAYLRTAARFGGPLVRDAILALSRRYVARLYNRFDYTLVCAERLRAVLRDWGVENVRPVKLGVDASVFTPGKADPEWRRRFGIPESAFLLLFVGRLAGEKNIRTLLDAFEQLRRQSTTDYRLLCVGQGPWRDQLFETREATGGALSWIPHIGSSSVLASLYRSVDLEVHPSVNETFGLVPLEAQACGLPVCGIRGNCLEENAMAGVELWAAANTPSSLAQAIERMRHSDLKSLGQVASQRARERYAWPVVLGDLWSTYRELVTRSRRRPAAAVVPSTATSREIVIRKYHARDRQAVRNICCETGFLGRPIDPVFEDRDSFADFLTEYYTDHEPESLFVLEIDGKVCGYLCGCRALSRRRAYVLTRMPLIALRVFRRCCLFKYKAASRRYLLWLIAKGRSETPPRPPGTPHFHINILPGARSIPGTKALIDAYLAYLRERGEKAVYGQMVAYEERRGDALFTRFGFNVLNRREITKYRDHFPGRVFLCTAYKELATESRLHGARIRFLKEKRV